MADVLGRALRAFDAKAFAERHRGYKESRSALSYEYLLPCPFCGGDRLRWRHEPNVKMAWVCWHCKKSGDTIQLVQACERLSLPEAISFICAGYVGGDAPEVLTETAQMPLQRQLERLPVIPWPEEVILISGGPVPPSWPPHQGQSAEETLFAKAWSYCAQRGIMPNVVREYRLGWGARGRVGGYLIFPVFMDGGLVYWQGRASWDPPSMLDKAQRKEWERQTNYRKTLNPIRADHTTGAEEVVFNYDRARAYPHIVICEGPIDAIKVGPHAVALLGKAWNHTKLDRLLRLPAQRYTVYLDRGEQERKSAVTLAAELNGFAPTFIATPPPGCDAGKLTPEQNAVVIQHAEPFRPALLSPKLNI